MTEYDYSPDAIERHKAKQASIATWVDKTKQHEPANPFVKLPEEHARLYPQRQQQQRQQVYAQSAASSSSVHASMTSTKNKSGPHRANVLNSRPPQAPPQTKPYFISPPTSPNGTYYLMPQAGQPPSLVQQQGSASLPMNGNVPMYSTPQVAVAPAYGQSKSSLYSPSAQSPPFVSQPMQNPYYGVPFSIQAPPNQPVVVPINGGVGGYVVVPAQGVTIVSQPNQYQNAQRNPRSPGSDSGSENGAGGSFFGTLNRKNSGTDTKARKNKKLRKATRTET
ncbi:hypothetical protein M413DRAFT_446174 [Hebeloma cylindrosporum]|uniref:Uncharacterized protein n=1 Tax=Hebeloma cylindrosporum TaxID=76867 RepID=A0A0C2XSX6_HEBCY|nr:hypothetical protein M413DRAFT_446174 [Hebeloma cylindrosporum h7]